MMETVLEMLTNRVEHLIQRADGPLHFRFLVMPLVVSTLAVRAFLRDLRGGHSVQPWVLFRDPAERRRLLRSGVRDFGRVFLVACVLDTVYQLIVLHAVYPGEMLLVAVMCAVVPYFLVRGPILRGGLWFCRKLAKPADADR